MIFYLGVHHANWLASSEVPLFVSRRTLAPMNRLPRAAGPWALDSGGFTELSMHGRWTLSARDYADQVQRFSWEVGQCLWAAPQDWMCEPEMLKRTGLTVAEHQRRTVDNYVELRGIAPELPIIPVLQGWTIGDYYDHIEAYAVAGVDLRAAPLVGVGSVCRRQSTIRISLLLHALRDEGLRLHGFGLKVSGLRLAAPVLASADSMAWSLSGRKNAPLPEHVGRHKSCANCFEYATEWRGELLASLGQEGS